MARKLKQHWSTKTVVICEDVKIDKQTVIQKIKSLSTAENVMMNDRGNNPTEIGSFIKYIFINN